MILRIDARGPGSDQISYKIGNHPGRQLIRRESEALGRLWFPEYEDDQCSVMLHVRSNIPSIPNRLTSSSIRYREWHRFAEWVHSFLGKALREPEPGGEQAENLEYRIKIGVLPSPVQYESELVDLFDRADLTVREPSSSNERFDRWLRLKASNLPFSNLLKRLSVLVPSLFGRHRSELDTGGYAGLLKNLRGTWFNLHPKKDFLTNRFLSLSESTTQDADHSPVSMQNGMERFEEQRELYNRIGQRISDMIEIPWTSEEQQLWIVNVLDGMILPGMEGLVEEFSTHLVEAQKKDLKRCEQRLNHLKADEDLQFDVEADRVHWHPAGFQNSDLSEADMIIWSPRSSEIDSDMNTEVAHEMMGIHQPDRLVVWGFCHDQEMVSAENIPVKKQAAGSNLERSEWSSIWEQVAEDKGYSVTWNTIDDVTGSDGSDSVLIGRFTG